MTYDYVYTKPPLEDVLEHHGIKGMRWGVRRYQNEDGSLTDKGRKRYGYNLDLTDKSKKNIANIRLGEARRRFDTAKMKNSSYERQAELRGRVRSAKRAKKNATSYEKGAKLAAKGQTIRGNTGKAYLAAGAAILGSQLMTDHLNKRLKGLNSQGRLTKQHTNLAKKVNAATALTLGGLALAYGAKKQADNTKLRSYQHGKASGLNTQKRIGSQEYEDRLKAKKKK